MKRIYKISHTEKTEVIIERGIVNNVDFVLENYKHTGYIIISDDTAYRMFGKIVEASLKKLNAPIYCKIIADGEQNKTLSTVSEVLQDMLSKKLDRKSAIIALGGGVIGDIATIVAALYCRGVDCIQIPTTLLAQVDSALGGKGGVNMNSMKNAVGLFKQPIAVIIDSSVLKTLPKSQISSGFGEALKYALCFDKEFFDLLKESQKADSKLLETTIKRCSQIKMSFVKRDPLDTSNDRAKLNFGHTFGHAIELIGKMPHGIAVAIGIAFAVRLSVDKKLLSQKEAEKAVGLLEKFNLPTRIPNISKDEIISNIRKDKKTIGGVTHFVLLEKIGKASYPHRVSEAEIQKALEEEMQ